MGHPSPPLDLSPRLASPWGVLLGGPVLLPEARGAPGGRLEGRLGLTARAAPCQHPGSVRGPCRSYSVLGGCRLQAGLPARGDRVPAEAGSEGAGGSRGWVGAPHPHPDAPGWGQGRRSQDLGVAFRGDSVSPQGGWRGARLPPPARREAGGGGGGGGGRWAGRRAVAEASCFCRIRLALCRTARGAEPLLAPAQSIC